ncbi:dihydrofolate reductase family protein [Streptomyces sp. 4N509B]|uniref:dihydrofolate reductase family protein n=1 Tax=Streptomyces sp. 4N509B TaxID=3457413 RepID=UPI003FCF8BC4
MSGILSVSAFVTLDGVMQAPGGPDEDRDGGFPHGGWSVPYFTEDLGAIIDEQFAGFSAFLLGRRTYEIFAAHWPHITDEEDPVAAKLNAAPKYVASRSLDRVTWHNAQLLSGDVGRAVAEVKEGTDGEINVQGSTDLIATLQRHDLVDRYRLVVEPVVLGTGKRLFAEGTAPAALRLTHSRQTAGGAVYCEYERAGEPTYGSFDLDTYEERMRGIRGTGV